MRIKLATSGGFAAVPGLAMQAEVNLSGTVSRVTQTGGAYTRDLSPEETQEVRRMIDPPSFFKLPAELRPANARDQRQYDITIQLDDGREHTVVASEMMAGDLDRLSPGSGKLLAWAKLEFDKIKRFNIGHRPDEK
jgi:hypothetical protein